MKRHLILLFLAVLPALQINAQVQTQYYQEGDTIYFNQDYLRTNLDTKIIRMPEFDSERMKKEDTEMEGLDVPYRFGKGFDVSYSLTDGQWQNINGGRLWTLTFESEGAISLNYIFENMYLPEGASLYIMNQNKTVVYGPVTSELCVPRGSTFLTDVIPGASSTIYLFEPLEKIGEATLTIKRVVHGYRGFDFKQVDRSLGDVRSCDNDVACSPTYENESKGIALVMLANGDELCSGALLMSTDLSFNPYLLTAFHCIDTDHNSYLSSSEKQTAENWMFKFCFKNTTCNGSSLATSYTYNKADFCSAWSNTDFALMKLKSSVSKNSLLTWLGWDKGSSTPTSGVGIHHPLGNPMKISYEYNSFSSCDYGSSGIYNHWLVNFDDGVVKHTSSGSPILNQKARVVGQLHGNDQYNGNLSYCLQPRAQYGKFNLSWTGGGTNSTRLSNWLDPVGTNQTTINSCHPLSIIGDNFICSTKEYYVQNLPSGYTVSWSLNDDYYNTGYNLLLQNHPSANRCTIVHSSQHDLDNATLTATIKHNGTPVRTVSKSGIYSYDGFRGHYTSGSLSDNIDYTYLFNIKANATTYITSQNFYGATVTYSSSGAAPSIWGFSPTYGDLTFVTTNTIAPVVINVHDVCGNNYVLYAMPSSSYSISVSNEDSDITVTLVEEGDAARGLTEPWTLEVINAETGRVMATQSSMNRSETISTTGWPKGIYIVKVTIGKEELTEKVMVK